MACILRIVAGKYGGRFIKAPEGVLTRPTAQVAREALFNMLAPRIAGVLFVDLFAGSGAIGIEALSRGAGGVIFVDKSRACCALIRENLRLVGAGGQEALVLDLDIKRDNFMRALREGMKHLEKNEAGVVFADPPYNFEGVDRFPLLISETAICAAGAFIIIEHSKKISMPQHAGIYAMFRNKKYGDSCVSFYSSGQVDI